jgi:hypothetical protein
VIDIYTESEQSYKQGITTYVHAVLLQLITYLWGHPIAHFLRRNCDFRVNLFVVDVDGFCVVCLQNLVNSLGLCEGDKTKSPTHRQRVKGN